MNRTFHFMLLSLVAAVVLVLVLYRIPDRGQPGDSGTPVVFFCAAGIKPPVEEIAKKYESEYGISVNVQYGGSGTLLSNIQVSRTGDLYLAGDESYLRIASEKGLVDEVLPVARMHSVIAVSAGNPRKIARIEDLIRPGIRVALGNPGAASIGKQTRKILEAAGLWKKVKENVRVFKPTVGEVANDIKLGTDRKSTRLNSSHYS